MLELTGHIKGKSYNEDLVSADDLIDIFDITLPKKTDVIRYSLVKSSGTIRMNRADGKETYAGAHLLTTFINGFYNGESVQLRYYNSKIPQGVGNPVKYVPRKIEFTGKSQAFSLSRQKEQAVFTYMFKWCEQSPLREPHSEKVYTLRDLSKENAKNLIQQELLQEVRMAILAMSDETAIDIGRGFRTGNIYIEDAYLGDGASAKVALLEQADRFLPEVHAAIHSQKVMIRGGIETAIKNGTIIPKEGKSGASMWHYSSMFAGGEQICQVLPGHNPKETLATYMMQGDNWLKHQQKMASDDTFVASQKALENEVNLDSPASIVALALTKEVIALHPTNDKVYIVLESGHLEDKALLNIKNRDEWKDELATRATAPILGRIKKRLNL